MAEGTKSAAIILLVVNLILYFIITVIGAWAVNHAIERSHESASALPIPARIFPIFFPIGNMATGFFIIFSLIAGVVGFTTSLIGFNSIVKWTSSELHTAASSSLLTWALTLLAMGFACKEIDIGWTGSNLRTLEVMTIITSATQLFCTGAVHVGAKDIDSEIYMGGRV